MKSLLAFFIGLAVLGTTAMASSAALALQLGSDRCPEYCSHDHERSGHSRGHDRGESSSEGGSNGGTHDAGRGNGSDGDPDGDPGGSGGHNNGGD